MAVAGKTVVERGFRFTMTDSVPTERDLSGDLVRASVSGIGLIYEEADMTGVSNGVVNFLANHPSSSISATFILNDTATTGAHTVIQTVLGSTTVLALRFGAAGAAPASGNPEWGGTYLVSSEVASFDGGKAVVNVTFVAGSATVPAWTTVT